MLNSVIFNKTTKSGRKKAYKSKNRTLVFTVTFILFLFYAITLIYPFVWMFISSLKTGDEFMNNSPFSLPAALKFSNYLEAMKSLQINDVSFFTMVFNSLWQTIISTAINIVVTCMTAYTISKYRFFGRGFVYGIAIVVMILPVVGSLPASYKLRIDLGIYDTPWQLITATGGFGFNFLILYGFFNNVSWSYAEAAFVDGASDDLIFWRIMLPQAAPAILTLSILSFIGGWNDYMGPILYYPSYPTLASGLYLYELITKRTGNYPIYFAGALISIIPILIIFIAFQDTIVTSVSAGGLKG